MSSTYQVADFTGEPIGEKIPCHGDIKEKARRLEEGQYLYHHYRSGSAIYDDVYDHTGKLIDRESTHV